MRGAVVIPIQKILVVDHQATLAERIRRIKKDRVARDKLGEIDPVQSLRELSG